MVNQKEVKMYLPLLRFGQLMKKREKRLAEREQVQVCMPIDPFPTQPEDQADPRIIAAFEHIARYALPVIKERLRAGRTSDEAAADILRGEVAKGWPPEVYAEPTVVAPSLPLVDRALLLSLAHDMEHYAAAEADAVNWGGPTIHPKNPITADRARNAAPIIRRIVELFAKTY
jgi:hypothetical protein